jgi:stage II sporulation protein D
MIPARAATLAAALLVAGSCGDVPVPAPGPPPAAPPGPEHAMAIEEDAPPVVPAPFREPAGGGGAASPPSAPPPPRPLPAVDPARVVVELRAAGPRTSVVLGSARGRLAEEGPPGGAAGVVREFAGVDVRIEAVRGGTLRVDGAPVPAGALRWTPAPGASTILDRLSYPGTIRFAASADGGLRAWNDAPLEDYLCGVLAGELFPDSPPEALRALAILARSFALSHLPDLSDDPGLHQAYKGVPPAAVLPVLRAAVSSTAGVRLVDAKGGPLPNYWYHSTCGGHTADASVVFGAPLTEAYGGVPCSKCVSSKYHRWESEIPEADVRRALRFGSAVAKLEIGSRSIDGRVLAFRATAAGGTVRYVPALQVRQALGANRLRSTLVAAVVAAGEGEGRKFRFTGRGWGHGVGLCQVGACTLAAEGRSAERILAFYYPGTKVVRAAR